MPFSLYHQSYFKLGVLGVLSILVSWCISSSWIQELGFGMCQCFGMTHKVLLPPQPWKPAASESRSLFCFLRVGQLISEQGVDFYMPDFTLFSNL